MDRDKCKAIRIALDKAIGGIGDALGVHLTVGRATYSLNNAVFKVEAADIVGGKFVTKEVEAFNMLATGYGLQKEDLGKKFMFQGTQYEVCGLKPSTEFPILAKRLHDGKVFKFQAGDIRNGWRRKPRRSCKRQEKAIIADLQQVEIDLSPENLCCDGELPTPLVHRRLRELEGRKAQLEVELGRRPTPAELWPEDFAIKPR
jgi:hypothetical protein